MKEPSESSGLTKGGIRELSLTCREAARLQSEALDHPLMLRQRIGLSIHLLLCKWCRRYGQQLGFLRNLVLEHGGRDEALPPQTLSPDAKQRMKQRLRAEE